MSGITPTRDVCVPWGSAQNSVRIWTDSDFVGDVAPRKSCSEVYCQRKAGNSSGRIGARAFVWTRVLAKGCCSAQVLGRLST